MSTFEQRVETALDRIRAVALSGAYIGHSGGKDSVVIHHLAVTAFPSKPWIVVHNPKAETHPLTEKFLATRDFPIYRVPSHYMGKWVAQQELDVQIDGTRAAEHDRTDGRSTDVVINGKVQNRKDMGHYVEDGLFGLDFCYPIFDWTDEQVWEYIYHHGLEVSEEYTLVGETAPKKTRVLIVAPHPDDELIGCWSVIGNPQNEVSVLVLHDLTYERERELTRAANDLGYKLTTEKEAINDLAAQAYDRVYVPSRKDSHAEHRAANAKFAAYATHYYSVDMVGGKPLSIQDREAKKKALDAYYPSQKALWERDHKYFLFEAISDKDYLHSVDIHFDLAGKKVRIVLPPENVKQVMQLSAFPGVTYENLLAYLLKTVEGPFQIEDPTKGMRYYS